MTKFLLVKHDKFNQVAAAKELSPEHYRKLRSWAKDRGVSEIKALELIIDRLLHPDFIVNQSGKYVP